MVLFVRLEQAVLGGISANDQAATGLIVLWDLSARFHLAAIHSDGPCLRKGQRPHFCGVSSDHVKSKHDDQPVDDATWTTNGYV